MTKISVNKIPFNGPKTHKQILEQIRADLAKTQNSISMEKVSFIVSSFFGRDVLFNDIPKKIKIWSSFIGSFYPGRMQDKKHRLYVAKMRRYNNAKKLLEDTARKSAYKRHESIIIKYNKWSEKRESKNLTYISLEDYMEYRKLVFKKAYPVTKEQIERSLWRFNNNGDLLVRNNSPAMRYHFAEKDRKEKAEKALQNQH